VSKWKTWTRALGLAALLLPTGCVLTPTGWDARTDGGRYPADRYGSDDCDPSRAAVDDMRAEAQNDICIDGWSIRFR